MHHQKGRFRYLQIYNFLLFKEKKSISLTRIDGIIYEKAKL